MVRHTVAELVAELQFILDDETPLSIRELERSQEEIETDLILLGPDAVDPIVASLDFTPSKVRVALFNALGAIGTWPALRAMMRFVFKEKNNISTAHERGFAMKAIAENACYLYQAQLSDFTKDIADDTDRWVTAFRIEIIMKIHDLSQIETVESYLTCEDTTLREKAREALNHLDEELPDELLRENSPDGLAPKDRRWINEFRYASPERRRELSKELTVADAFPRISSLSALDDKGASLALQWIVTVGDDLPDPERFQRLAEDLLSPDNNDLATLAIQALRTTLRKTGAPLSPKTARYIDRALTDDVSLLRNAVKQLFGDGVDQLRHRPTTEQQSEPWCVPLFSLLLRNGTATTVDILIGFLYHLAPEESEPFVDAMGHAITSLPFYFDSLQQMHDVYPVLVDCYLNTIRSDVNNLDDLADKIALSTQTKESYQYNQKVVEEAVSILRDRARP